jgi:hypothetical protein
MNGSVMNSATDMTTWMKTVLPSEMVEDDTFSHGVRNTYVPMMTIPSFCSSCSRRQKRYLYSKGWYRNLATFSLLTILASQISSQSSSVASTGNSSLSTSVDVLISRKKRTGTPRMYRNARAAAGQKNCCMVAQRMSGDDSSLESSRKSHAVATTLSGQRCSSAGLQGKQYGVSPFESPSRDVQL